MKFVFKILTFCIFITAALYGQVTPTVHYNVFTHDTLYVFTSDTQLLLFSNNDNYNGDFRFLSAIPGSYNIHTSVIFNNDYALVRNADTLLLYDFSNPYSPRLMSHPEFNFDVGSIFGFGPYFIINSNHILKLMDIQNDDLIVKEDSMITLDPDFCDYPYINRYTKFYKYAEGFGTYAIYTMDDIPSGGYMDWLFLADHKMIYHVVKPNDPEIPSVCALRIRTIEEPNFQIIHNGRWWAGCQPVYFATFLDGSKRYVYLLSSGGNHKSVYNITGNKVYEHPYDEWQDYKVKVKGLYIFKLGEKIFYSLPYYPSTFYELNYSITSVDDHTPSVNKFILKNNYPNPFNPSTVIEYELPDYSLVNLTVTNILGEKVAVLVNEEEPAGIYKVNFNGANLPSGIYFYNLRAGTHFISKKMVLVK